MRTSATSDILLVIRFGFLIAALWMHFNYFRVCLRITDLPPDLTSPSRDPLNCRKGRTHSHLIYYSRSQFDPRVSGHRILYNLGTAACPAVLNHTNANNAYQTIGHKTVLILRNEPHYSVLIGKVHHQLNVRTEDFPRWASWIDKCLKTATNVSQTVNEDCALDSSLCEINRLQLPCHCHHLAKLLSLNKRRSQVQIVNAALHPALVVHPSIGIGLTEAKSNKQLNGATVTADSWPFARYIGGCGIFAVTEYVGCPLSDFFYANIYNRITIALKVLEVAMYLDGITETDIGNVNLYNRDFHLGNLALGVDGRVYISDTDEISILYDDPESMDEWLCSSGLMQNSFDALTKVLSETAPSTEDEIFNGFMNGLQETKELLDLQPHPVTPTQKKWIEMSKIERIAFLNDVTDSLTETLMAASNCDSILRWILTGLCVIVWIPASVCWELKRQMLRKQII